jgi:AAA domain
MSRTPETGHELADFEVPDATDQPTTNGHVELDDREREVVAQAQELVIADEAKALARNAKESKTPLVVRTADLSRARPPKWAWQGRFLIGYLNLLLGNEGSGKGTLAAAVIARLSRGKLVGDLLGKPVTVAVLGDEDSFDDVWVPRLHAAKADLGRVVQIERPDGGYVELREDRDKLADAVEQHGIRVVYLDALIDNLGVGVDDWRQKAVRDALGPARFLARELNVAVIGSLHPNKRAEDFRKLVAGSSAFNAVSRSSLLLADDPDHDGRKVLVRGKGNLAAAPAAITFAIESYEFKANGKRFNVPVAVDFADGGTLTANELIATTQQKERESRSVTKKHSVEELIRELLPQDGKWHRAKPIISKCEEANFTRRTVYRAAEKLGLEHRRKSEFKSRSEWRWPATRANTRAMRTTGMSGTSGTSGKEPVSSTHDTRATHDTHIHGTSGGTSAKRLPAKAKGKRP